MGSGLYTHGSIHDTVGTAYDLTNTFSLAANANIQDSTTLAHTTMRYSSASGDSAQYYAIALVAGSTIILDIDATTGVDTWITTFWQATAQPFCENDDETGLDPGIDYEFPGFACWRSISRRPEPITSVSGEFGSVLTHFRPMPI
jgi:hypothetical protein